jgi:beta-lactam-binding protein with PASTA domain
MTLIHALIRGASAALVLIAVAIATGFVTMWLAMERDTVQLPRVIGLNADRALDLLREQGLRPRITGREHSDHAVKDTVLHQRPASGSWVLKDSEVRLIVSRGSDTVAIPTLIGLQLEQASRVLQAHGLTPGRVVRIHTPQHPEDEVIAQDPEADSAVPRGSVVALLVSLGPRETPPELLMPPARTYRNALGGEGAPSTPHSGDERAH